MRVLLAPDKFKGSLGATKVAECLAAGLRAVIRGLEITILPVADGGEGTADAIVAARDGEWRSYRAHDPLGREIGARVGWLEETRTAVMEMSEAAGMRRLSPNELDPLNASTFGVGEMLFAAAQEGADEIIIGLGGSATNDGGFGMARALGFRFLNSSGDELSGPVSELLQLENIVVPNELKLPRVTGACDVRNPLLGPRGATNVYGRQKGATPAQIEVLENALTRLAEVTASSFQQERHNVPAAGAAGGLGFGLLTFVHAQLRAGFDLVAELIQLRPRIIEADIVVTGEGKLDGQTEEGKAPAGVARMARELGKPVYAIVGQSTGEAEIEGIFDGVIALDGGAGSAEETGRLLELRARSLAQRLCTR